MTSTNVLELSDQAGSQKLLAVYKMLMSPGMSTEQLDQTATWVGATRMRRSHWRGCPRQHQRICWRQNHPRLQQPEYRQLLLDSLHLANRQKTRQAAHVQGAGNPADCRRAEAAQR